MKRFVAVSRRLAFTIKVKHNIFVLKERKKKRCSQPSPSLVFPDEVKLCRSSVPGAEFGVCAAQPIPPGTWIGPYEGQVVRRDELREGAHNNYMWEVGKIV